LARHGRNGGAILSRKCQLAPYLAISPTDNWIAINLRYYNQIINLRTRGSKAMNLFEGNSARTYRQCDGMERFASKHQQASKIPEMDLHLKQ